MGYDHYYLLTDKNQFQGTCGYIEFVPGKYSDNERKDNTVFLMDDSMDIIYDLFDVANNEFCYYNDTYFNDAQVNILIDGLSARLAGIKNDKDYKLSEDVDLAESKNKEIKQYRNSIIKMLEDLIAWINTNRAGGITVLGV